VFVARFGIKACAVAFDLSFCTYCFAPTGDTSVVFSAIVQTVAAVFGICEDILARSKAHLLVGGTVAGSLRIDACT
jgi:hypothetical protein